MIVERVQYLTDISKNKTILHCGAAEGKDTRVGTKNQNKWLHKHLTDNAIEVVGIDISPDDEENIHYCNLENMDDCIAIKSLNYNYDYIIFGEIIEHLFNPGLVLDNLKMFDGELIITTPNAFSIRKYLYAFINREFVSKTHTCYYSTDTLEYLLNSYGYTITKTLYYGYFGKLGFLQKMFFKIFPKLADGIILHARKI